MGAWFVFGRSVEEVAVSASDTLSAVDRLDTDISPVASSCSGDSLTSPPFSVHSGYSTMTPLTPGQIERMEMMVGPDWRYAR